MSQVQPCRYLVNRIIKDFKIKLKTIPDKFIFTVGWDNRDTSITRGIITARGAITKDSTGNNNPILTVDIEPTDVFLNGDQWSISKSTIRVDSNAIKINKLNISSKNNYYLIHGSVSENLNDTLYLKFNGIDISPLNLLVNKNKSADDNPLQLDFKGFLDGNIVLTNVYKNLLLESNVVIKSFSLLGSDFGDISINSAYDINKKAALIKASNNINGTNSLKIDGYYDPVKRKLDLTGIASKLSIDALNPLLKMFASGITGTVSGKVNFIAEPGKILLLGGVKAEECFHENRLPSDYLQTQRFCKV